MSPLISTASRASPAGRAEAFKAGFEEADAGERCVARLGLGDEAAKLGLADEGVVDVAGGCFLIWTLANQRVEAP